MRKIGLFLGGLLTGIALAYLFLAYAPASTNTKSEKILSSLEIPRKQVIGFLPYWLLEKAKTDYSPYISTLTYFGLTIDTDGKILKMQNEQENEPGWNALKTGKVDPFLDTASKNHQKLSLLVFSGDEASISALLTNPQEHAKNLVSDIKPFMQEYHFTDLNLDIESIVYASDEARMRFTQFVKAVKKGVDDARLGTVTLDIAPDALVNQRLIDVKAVADAVDYIVLMGYDYHFIGSTVTGPVAPLFGAGTISEYDTNAAVQLALQTVQAKKIILGIPLYGYEWETLRSTTRSATIPSSGQTASTKRISQLLSSCTTCSAQLDSEAKENYLIYKDDEVGTYHQFFYPDEKATQAKIAFVKQQKLGGLALWALGYEDGTILEPLKKYK